MLNFVAVAIASVAGMAVGALWFSKALLGRPWARAAGVELGAATHWSVYLLALVATVVTAVVQALATSFVHESVGGSFLGVALVVAAVGWLGFTAARCAVEYLFEQRPVRLYVIDMGHQLTVVLVMGLVIGLFGI
ncbi:hypothetical protein GCM10009775_06570 [Microbacterium aoyamense]|uniref:DUF1761 domain-containing protein n=1 Tax=Microbacterium aoyamense TaxID=344166 RepID=A0ABP5ANH8_9MICO|nr:DUF1761 domain-containing protein [Microbacterium aoyamense]